DPDPDKERLMPGIDINAELGHAPWAAANRDGVLRALQRARLDRMLLSSRRALAGDVQAGDAELREALGGQAALSGWITANPVDTDLTMQELRRAPAANIVGLRIRPHAFGLPLHAEPVGEIANAFRRYGKPAMITVETEQDVREFEELARLVPTVKFIAAGAGGDDWLPCRS